uniref:Uncharacterized protein n=1 Tax=uncultured delta proteobacterium DeepAnt-32C6 TaxID=357895 RepID=Q2I6K4_9DELT|nr:hypothetical protein [uncultured delta proteobacterium DeepAnt-32C6]
MRCMITIGRIVSHPCGQKAAAPCSRCGTACCKHHLSRQSSSLGQCCVCSGEYTPVEAKIRVTMEEMFDFSPDDLAAFDRDQEGMWSIGPYDS